MRKHIYLFIILLYFRYIYIYIYLQEGLSHAFNNHYVFLK